MTGTVHLACGVALLLMTAHAPTDKYELTEKPNYPTCVAQNPTDRPCFAPLLEAEGGIDILGSFAAFAAQYDESNRLRVPGTTFTRAEARAMAAAIAVTPAQRLSISRKYGKLEVDDIRVDRAQFEAPATPGRPKAYPFVARVTYQLREGDLEDHVVHLRGHVDLAPEFESDLQGLDPENTKIINDFAAGAVHVEAASDSRLSADDTKSVLGPAVLVHLYFATLLADEN